MDKEEIIKDLESKQKYLNDLTSENEMLEKEKENIKLSIQNSINLQQEIKNSNYNIYQQLEVTPTTKTTDQKEPSISDIIGRFKL